MEENSINEPSLEVVESDEMVLDMHMPSIDRFIALDSDVHEQRLHGGVAIQLDSGFNVKNDLATMTIPVFESQCHNFFSKQVQIMTSDRIVQVVALRPIDQLMKVLNQQLVNAHEQNY